MSSNLVMLRGGEGRAVVCLHGASGLVTGFRRLSPHLGGSGPVIAFENIEPGPDAMGSIDALAEFYWAQVEHAVVGGLDLVGWSFGGGLAVAMAKLAEDAGYEVGTVALLDAAPPCMLRHRWVEPLREMAGLFEVDVGKIPENSSVASVEEALAIVAANLQGRQPGVTVDDLRPFADVYSWHLSVLRASGPLRTPDAPAVLVRAEAETGWDEAPSDLGWSQVFGVAPEVRWTPGNHHSVMSAVHAPTLAAVLNEILL